MITIFTDGACDFNKKGSNNKGAFAFVILNDAGIKIQEYGEVVLNTTNNRMELMAVITSLKTLKNVNEEILINSDSEYVVKGIMEGRYIRWAEKQWKKGENDIPNTDLWKSLIALLRPNVKLKWVKAHTNSNCWNDYVDKLAQQKIDDYKLSNRKL